MPEAEGVVRIATSPFRFGLTNPSLFSDPAKREYQSFAIGTRFTDLAKVPMIFRNTPDADIAEPLAVLLARWGHEVRAERNPHRGLRAALTPPPFDLVLLDIGLPELDGYAVARQLRQDLGTRTRLVAFTGYGGPEDRQRAREAGFDDLITKPLDIDVLEQLLARLSPATEG